MYFSYFSVVQIGRIGFPGVFALFDVTEDFALEIAYV